MKCRVDCGTSACEMAHITCPKDADSTTPMVLRVARNANGELVTHITRRGFLSADLTRIQAIDADSRIRIASLPIATPVSAVPLDPALRGLRVLVRTTLMGSVPGGPEALAMAKRETIESAKTFFTELGWTPVTDESASHDLEAELAFTGHVTWVDMRKELALLLPEADRPSLRLTAEKQDIVSIPAATRAFRCEGSGTGDERKKACGDLASKAANARLINAMNESGELRAFAERVKRGR